jgi:predicted nucleic acid-binding protein
MKSAYELAMERLNKQSPTVKLTAAQKAEIAEAERVCKAKVAELELSLKDEMNALAEKQDVEAMYAAEERFKAEKRKLEAKLEERREAIRTGK